MQRLSGFLLLTAIACLSACKGHDKKVVVYASNAIKVDDTKKNVTVASGDGTTHHEQELDFPTGDPVTIEAQTPQGKTTISVTDDGLYIANLKNDTVIGSQQHIGSEADNGKITQDVLKQKLDSLQKLSIGQNVSEANHNFFIVPGKTVKITSETKARIFGPYTSIPGSFDAGSVPEVYKFYSMKEIREIIGNLEKMTK